MTTKNSCDTYEAGWSFHHYEAKNGVSLPYQIYIPNGMDRSLKYPLLLFLHGMGSVGTDGGHIYQKVAEYLRVLESSEYRDGVIIIAPQCTLDDRWVELERKKPVDCIYSIDKTPISRYLTAAKELLDTACNELPIDTDRIYGYGNSMGAYGTLYLACVYPELYAAIVPVAGGCDPTKAALLKDLPMWLFHGNADTVVDIAGSREMVEEVKRYGGEDARLTVFDGVGHHAVDCFAAAARTQGLAQWMFSKKKNK